MSAWWTTAGHTDEPGWRDGIRAASLQPPASGRTTPTAISLLRILPESVGAPSPPSREHRLRHCWRRRHDWPAHPCGPPRRRAPDSARSCVSRQARSARPYDRPRLPAVGSARNYASRREPLCHPYLRSAAAAPGSLTRIHDWMYVRPELVREPSLLSSTVNAKARGQQKLAANDVRPRT